MLISFQIRVGSQGWIFCQWSAGTKRDKCFGFVDATMTELAESVAACAARMTSASSDSSLAVGRLRRLHLPRIRPPLTWLGMISAKIPNSISIRPGEQYRAYFQHEAVPDGLRNLKFQSIRCLGQRETQSAIPAPDSSDAKSFRVVPRRAGRRQALKSLRALTRFRCVSNAAFSFGHIFRHSRTHLPTTL